MTLPASLENLDGLKKVADGFMARCPVHPDRNPSLHITLKDGEPPVAYCHAGCEQSDVDAALGLNEMRKGSKRDAAEWTPRGDATAVYRYVDETGKHLFDVCRTADKQFPQRRPDPSSKSGWKWTLDGVRRVPYRLPELIAAVGEGQTVYITEGEKDALALVGHGKAATCNPGGAGKWRPEYADYFRDAAVIICADKDKPGQAHARQVAATLDGIANAVWIVEAADPHKDVAAHLGAGLTLDQLTITHRPNEPTKPDLAPDIYDILDEPDDEYAWLVPGLLERGERFMLTGFEGLGKSQMLRGWAVAFAAGINPVDGSRFRPLRVLQVDCENTSRQIRRTYYPIVTHAAGITPVPAGGLRIIRKPEGIDLGRDEDAAWLLERVTAHKPDVLFIGPLYRLHIENPNDESTARKLVQAIDAARIRADCAVILEAHAGHGEWGKHRSVRPVGSSLYLRWPEFGYGLRPAEGQENEGRPTMVEMVPWRGARDERSWPKLWAFGSQTNSGFPWVPFDQRPTGHLALASGEPAAIEAPHWSDR